MSQNCTHYSFNKEIEIDIFGYIGAFCISLFLIPQVYQTYKLKQCEEISICFVILQTTASICFIIYGYLIASIPLIIANSIALFCSILLLIAKYIYSERSPILNNILNNSNNSNDYIITVNSPTYIF